MDTRDLDASLKQAESQIEQAEHSIAAARAELEQAASQVTLTAQELQRAHLAGRGFETHRWWTSASRIQCGPRGLHRRTGGTINRARCAARDAAAHNANVIRVNIADSALVAPKDGPIHVPAGERRRGAWRRRACLHYARHELCLHRCACLPDREAGRVELGLDARRALLDAQPMSVAAKVVFVARAKPVYSEDGGNQGGARRADVPRARAHRPRIWRGRRWRGYVRDFQGLRMCWWIPRTCGRHFFFRCHDAVAVLMSWRGLRPVIHVFVGCT